MMGSIVGRSDIDSRRRLERGRRQVWTTVVLGAGLLVATALGIAAVAAAAEVSTGKVEICHTPPGCPTEAHTIQVGAAAVGPHLAHGDREGPCEPYAVVSSEDCVSQADTTCAVDTDADSDDGESDYEADDDSDDDGDSEHCKAGRDECAACEHDCSPDAICIDLPHSYTCECKPGYEGDGWTCTPVYTGCATNADCEVGEACYANGDCGPVAGCTTNADCEAGETCDANGDCGPATGGCTSDADCQAGEVCYADGTCGPGPGGCSSNDDCPPGNVCNLGTGECQSIGGPCSSDTDCGLSERCFLKSGWCGPAGDPCATDSDCPQGQLCHTPTHTCQAPNGSCATDPSECTDPCRENYECRNNQCIGVPVCHPLCSRCDGGECSNLCANPHEPNIDDVDIIDCLFSLRATVSLENCPVCICDVNADGKVTVTDTLKILRYLVLLPEELQCPDPAAVPVTPP